MSRKRPETIIRAPRSSEHPYFATRRAVAQDARLTWEARGMLWYIFSKPDDWEIRESDLEQQCGRDKVRRVIRELKRFGYLMRVQIKGRGGRFAGTITQAYEIPLTGLPSTEKPSTEKPSPENPPPTNKRKRNRLQNDRPTSPNGDVPPIQDKSLHPQMVSALVEAFGKGSKKLSAHEGKVYGLAAAELLAEGVKAEDVAEGVETLTDMWDGKTFTPRALVTHLSDWWSPPAPWHPAEEADRGGDDMADLTARRRQRKGGQPNGG